MLERAARPVFIVACAANAVFAFGGAFTLEDHYLIGRPLAPLGGGLAFLVAATVGLVILWNDRGMHRNWIKAALVFIALGPLAFWGLQWPAAIDTICMGRLCASEEAFAFRMRAVSDVMQSHMVMIAVALAALFCATRATTITFDELAA